MNRILQKLVNSHFEKCENNDDSSLVTIGRFRERLEKITQSELDALKALEVMDGYHINVNSSKERKGYSGTAILSKELPINISNDIGIDLHDKEGRVMLFENKNFFLVNVYVPNSGQELRRLDYRNKWDYDFLNYCKKLSQKKPTIVTGDFNVAHKEIDLARPKENSKNPGFTQEERSGFQRIIDSGFIDIFRELENKQWYESKRAS